MTHAFSPSTEEKLLWEAASRSRTTGILPKRDRSCIFSSSTPPKSTRIPNLLLQQFPTFRHLLSVLRGASLFCQAYCRRFRLSYTFFKKKRKIFAARKGTGHKKGRSFVLAEKTSALEREGKRKKRPNASKRAIKAPPRACCNSRESARQDVKTQSHRIHFTYGAANRL